VVKKISMDISETLEMDYLVEQVSDDVADISSRPSDDSTSMKYISTRTSIFDPQNTGTYQVDINGQTIEIEVTDIPESGVSRWDFDDSSDTSTATDSWGTNDGQINGAGYESAYQGSHALYFDGTENYVTVTDNATLNFDSTESFTVSGWLNLDALSKNVTMLAKRDGSGNNFEGYQIQVRDADGEFAFFVDDGVSGSSVSARGGTPTTGSWVHLAGTFDRSSGDLTLYIDGSSVGSTSSSLGAVSPSANFYVGAYENLSSEYFNGKIDDVRIYDKALSAPEVSNLYNTGCISG
jgi:hypothetical protein